MITLLCAKVRVIIQLYVYVHISKHMRTKPETFARK